MYFWDLCFLGCAAAVLIFYKLGTKSLTTYDELFYAQSAKEMLHNGNWLTPFYFGSPFFDKPPLYMWVTAGFYALFGVSEWSARLIAALAGVGSVLITYLLTRKLDDRKTGLLAALLLLSSIHFFNYAKLATLDMALTFFVCLSLYLFYLGLSKPAYHLGMGLALAGAILTKGLGGFLPFFIIFVYLLLVKNLRLLKSRYLLAGLFIGLLVPALWVFYEYGGYGQAFMQGVFWVNFSRVHHTLDQHTGSFFRYFQVIFSKGKLLSGPALIASFYLLGDYFFGKKRDVRTALPLAWVFVVLLLFSLTRTKLHWYIMPIYPALFMLLSVTLTRFISSVAVLRAVVIGSFAFLGVYQLTHPGKFNDDTNAVFKQIGQTIAGFKHSEDRLFVYGDVEVRAIAFYADMPPHDMGELTPNTARAIIVTDQHHFEALKPRVHLLNTPVYHFGKYLILQQSEAP